jgi:hypothetical protein
MSRANNAYWHLTEAVADDSRAIAAVADIREAMNHLIDLVNQDGDYGHS